MARSPYRNSERSSEFKRRDEVGGTDMMQTTGTHCSCVTGLNVLATVLAISIIEGWSY